MPAERQVAAGWWKMLASAALATAIIAPMSLRWCFHDEQLFTGHIGVVAQIQNDHYPPRHMTFPDLEYRYHYGFDLAATAITAVLRVSPILAIDVLTLVSWAYTWCLLWVVGDELLGRGRGWLTAAITLFGGGLPFLPAFRDGAYLERALVMGEAGGVWLNPPIISYFFQHPWGLGLPFGLCAILIVLDRGRPGFSRYASLAILLSALSISHIVVFASLMGAIPVSEVFSDRSYPRRRVLGMVAALLIAIATGRAAGGFFLPPPHGGNLAIGVRLGITDSPTTLIEWHALTFGLLIPLGLCGLLFLRRGRLPLALLIAGGLGVVNLFYYAHSWDISKFATVAAIGLSIAAGATVARAFDVRPKFLGRILGFFLLAGITADGLAFPILFALEVEGIPRSRYCKDPSPLPSQDDVEAINWLRSRVPPGESVYRNPSIVLAYDHLGGLAVPYFDSFAYTFGFSRERMSRRAQLLAIPSRDPAPYEAEKIRWFVLDPGDAELSHYADAWINQGLATKEATFGPLRIVRLLPPRGP